MKGRDDFQAGRAILFFPWGQESGVWATALLVLLSSAQFSILQEVYSTSSGHFSCLFPSQFPDKPPVNIIKMWLALSAEKGFYSLLVPASFLGTG